MISDIDLLFGAAVVWLGGFAMGATAVLLVIRPPDWFAWIAIVGGAALLVASVLAWRLWR